MGAAAPGGTRQADADCCRPRSSAFGLWVEQLVAESTGKHGRRHRADRRRDARRAGTSTATIGCSCACASPTTAGEERRDDASQALRRDAPVATIDLPEPAALGAEFVRWEIATAIAGALLDINPFDEPNVQQAKDATRVLLDATRPTDRLPTAAPDTHAPTASR